MDIIEDFETTRRKYLLHETLIKSIDSLFWVGSAIGIVSLLTEGGLPAPRLIGTIMGTLISYKNESFRLPLYWTLKLSFLILFVCQACVALGLRRLRPYARIFGVVIALLGMFDTGLMGFHILGYQLFGFPHSTVLCIAILWLLFSRRGRYIFSPEYRHVIERTPHIKSKISLLVWGIVILHIGGNAFLTLGFPLLRFYLRQ